MPFRKALYWAHLFAALIAGIIILTMSATGVLLTYEKQMISAAEPTISISSITSNNQRLSIDALIDKANNAYADGPVTNLTLKNQEDAAVQARYGRTGRLYFNPETGENMGEGPTALRDFMSWAMQFHRWFALSGEGRDSARLITNTANLMFLFILISGIYLWLPRVFRWHNFQKILFFQKNKNAKARDFNWHHVMGIWSVLPLVVIVATATVFYYPWANDAVYRLAGEEPPVRSQRAQTPEKPALENSASFDSLYQTAAGYAEGWQTISFNLPKDNDEHIQFSIDHGTGGEPTKRGTLTLDRSSGAVVSYSGFADNSPGRQARIYVRFLHTGEALGPIGQTIAGLVSLACLFMIWTGMALAWRKYILPLLKASH